MRHSFHAPALGYRRHRSARRQGPWYRGNFEVLGEGEFLLNTHPRGSYGAGMTVMARYNWLRDADWIPFFEVGAGILYLGLDLDQQSATRTSRPRTAWASTAAWTRRWP